MTGVNVCACASHVAVDSGTGSQDRAEQAVQILGGEIHRIVANMELVCGITMLTNERLRDPKRYLERLDQELEAIKEDWVPSWRSRIKEILEII
jgi:hypothetical protein